MIEVLMRYWRTGLTALVVVVVVAGTAVWAVDGRPALLTPFDGGMGTEASPWQISTADRFVAIEEDYLEGSFVLTDDIDFAELDEEEVVGVGSSSEDFRGRFDGDDHTVENFSVRVDEGRNIGLFRRSGGTIEAVEMVGVDIEAKNSTNVGSLVAYNWGEVIDVQVSGDVRGKTDVGGLVGSNRLDGEIVGAQVSGTVGGKSDGDVVTQLGGLVGSNGIGARVVTSESSATVEAGGDIVAETGGLVGSNRGEVIEGKATGDVEGRREVGGLVGANRSDGEVIGGRARGDVEGSKDVGGLVGSSRGKVVDAVARGDVEGDRDVGGLVGSNRSDGEVIAGAARGDVGGEDHVGGFVGSMSSVRVHDGPPHLVARIVDGVATGDVEGSKDVGGFVGRHGGQVEASIARSYSIRAVDGDENVGGFAGVLEPRAIIEDSYWNVDTAGLDTSAGGVGMTDDEFADSENFEGFVFCPGEDCRWVMDDEKGRPVLERLGE